MKDAPSAFTADIPGVDFPSTHHASLRVRDAIWRDKKFDFETRMAAWRTMENFHQATHAKNSSCQTA